MAREAIGDRLNSPSACENGDRGWPRRSPWSLTVARCVPQSERLGAIGS